MTDLKEKVVISVDGMSISIGGRQITRDISLRMSAGEVSA